MAKSELSRYSARFETAYTTAAGWRNWYSAYSSLQKAYTETHTYGDRIQADITSILEAGKATDSAAVDYSIRAAVVGSLVDDYLRKVDWFVKTQTYIPGDVASAAQGDVRKRLEMEEASLTLELALAMSTVETATARTENTAAVTKSKNAAVQMGPPGVVFAGMAVVGVLGVVAVL